MKLTQLRNATIFLDYGDHKFIVDPMLGKAKSIFPFKIFGKRRRNPLVPLPDIAEQCLSAATGVILTHEHLDHFDPAGLKWVKQRELPIYASPIDVKSLRSKKLKVQELRNGLLDFAIEVIPSQHSHGLFRWFLGPVAGVFLARKDSPSLYLIGDSVLTDNVREAIARLKPDVIVAPAGAANFGFGADILFSLEELVELAKLAPGSIVFNHLEAIDHCPTTRSQLRELMAEFGEKVLIPEDGETIDFLQKVTVSSKIEWPVHEFQQKPGLQKWITKQFAGT